MDPAIYWETLQFPPLSDENAALIAAAKAGGDGSEPTQSWSGVLDLNAGVKLKVYGRHNQGNNQTIKSTNSHCLATFQAYRIN